jgi:pimeloyl-ACP methyl ester carboxylesterase
VPYALSLARYFHVYLFDNPGFGDSPLPAPSSAGNEQKSKGEDAEIPLDADLAMQSGVFAALFDSWCRSDEQGWKGRKPQVVAHDHGGLMALRAHLLHACDYASLCLIDVVAIGPFGQPLFKLVAENEAVFKQLTGPVFEGVVEAYIRDAAHKPLREETMKMLKAPWLKDRAGREGFVRQMCQANSRSTSEVEGMYASVGEKMPVRIIWGKEDKWIPVETAERLGQALNAKDVVVLEGAGHLIMYDQPERLGLELGWWFCSNNQI